VADCPVLTRKEATVLTGIVEDRTYAQIADGMALGVESVRKYAARLRKKLGARSKTGLAAWGAKNKGAIRVAGCKG
jgi:DNA-binding CsgD family transcriptional regulator